MRKPYLFNSEDFLQNQGAENRLLFSETSKKNSLHASALFNMFVQGQTGYSPIKAPFGSIEFSDDFSAVELDRFVRNFTLKALELGLSEIIITSYPNCYEPNKSEKLKIALVRNGFEPLWNELNYHIPVDTKPFIQKIHPSERWKLRQAHKAGYTAKLWENPALDTVYELIQESRNRKGFELSLRKQEFIDMFVRLPEKYFVFGIWNQQTLAAVAVTVTVSEKICYIFYTADQMAYRRLSPVVMLHELMYDFSYANHFKLLDLGTASKHGKINQGVADFKRRLGGLESEKSTFIKHLSL